MNKRFLVIVLTFLLAIPCYSQIQIDCSVLDHRSVNRRIDTLTINAEYLEIGKIPIYKKIDHLERLRMVRVKDFKCTLGFRLKGCDKNYYIPMQGSWIRTRKFFFIHRYSKGSQIKPLSNNQAVVSLFTFDVSP